MQSEIDVVGRGELIYPTGVQLTIPILLWPIERGSQNAQECTSGIWNTDAVVWKCNNNVHRNKITDLTIRNSVPEWMQWLRGMNYSSNRITGSRNDNNVRWETQKSLTDLIQICWMVSLTVQYLSAIDRVTTDCLAFFIFCSVSETNTTTETFWVLNVKIEGKPENILMVLRNQKQNMSEFLKFVTTYIVKIRFDLFIYFL